MDAVKHRLDGDYAPGLAGLGGVEFLGVCRLSCAGSCSIALCRQYHCMQTYSNSGSGTISHYQIAPEGG